MKDKPSAYLLVWKERNIFAFDYRDLSIQRLKLSSASNLWILIMDCITEGHFLF